MAARDTRSERVDTARALGDFYADISLAQGFPYGLQHVLAVFVANLAPIFIVAAAAGMDAEQSSALIQNALLMAGLGTMIQLFPLWRVGGALPIVTGISFTYVSAVVAIVAALALASGIGFTQVQGIFAAFPPIVQSIFGSNCIAVAFVVAVVANLLLPKEQADEE
ncbi:solute carrier family 23 protein [Enorma phocaeensis]|uniref:solute carrier family 23 protein n=1 Tax=Enorma phocaeensis TaxID=1871019 RepID=UPI003208CB4F